MAEGSDVEAFLDAAGHGDIRTVRKLLKSKKVDVDASFRSGNSALILAAGRDHNRTGRHFRTVRSLVSHNASVTHTDNYGFTALHNCCGCASPSSASIADFLIDAKSDVNARSASGKTALFFAAEFGGSSFGLQVVQILIDRGARTDAASHCRYNLFEAARENLHFGNPISSKMMEMLEKARKFECCEGT